MGDEVVRAEYGVCISSPQTQVHCGDRGGSEMLCMSAGDGGRVRPRPGVTPERSAAVDGRHTVKARACFVLNNFSEPSQREIIETFLDMTTKPPANFMTLCMP